MWITKTHTLCFSFVAITVIHQSCCCSDELFQAEKDVDWGKKWCYSKPECAVPTWPSACHDKNAYLGARSPINLDYNKNGDQANSTSALNIPMSGYIFPGFQMSYRVNTIHVIPDSSDLAEIWWPITKPFDDNKTVLVDVAPPSANNAPLSNFLEPIVSNLGILEHNRYKQVRAKLNLQIFQGDTFFEYIGKFTAPSCRFNDWFVQKRPLFVPRLHIEQIRNFKPSTFFVESNNFRNIFKRDPNQKISTWRATLS